MPVADMPAQQMCSVFVELEGFHTILVVDAHTSESIGFVKAQIQDKAGMPIAEQRLLLQDDGSELLEDRTLVSVLQVAQPQNTARTWLELRCKIPLPLRLNIYTVSGSGAARRERGASARV